MGIFDWFRREPSIADREALIEFLDSRAAFIAQKSIFDYARALSGPFFSQLIKERAFAEAVDKARWQNYPRGLALVAEMIHVVLRPAANAPASLAAALAATALEAFDRHPVPTPLNAVAWQRARDELAIRIKDIALHPSKRIMDIPEPVAQLFFDAMPIHERLRGRDFETIHNLLRANLVRMHDDFTRRADVSALIAALDLDQTAAASQVE